MGLDEKFTKKRNRFTEKYSNISEGWGLDVAQVELITKTIEDRLLNNDGLINEESTDNLAYHKDKRTLFEYAYDVHDGWVQEDLIKIWFENKIKKINENLQFVNVGTDNDRIFQIKNEKKITSTPDFNITLNGKLIKKIETQVARESRNSFDMKENKIKTSIQENGIIMWVIIPDNKFFIIDPTNEMSGLETYYNFLWQKQCYNINSNFIENVGGFYDMKDDLSDAYLKKIGLK
jgi:hypothetical protein